MDFLSSLSRWFYSFQICVKRTHWMSVVKIFCLEKMSSSHSHLLFYGVRLHNDACQKRNTLRTHIFFRSSYANSGRSNRYDSINVCTFFYQEHRIFEIYALHFPANVHTCILFGMDWKFVNVNICYALKQKSRKHFVRFILFVYENSQIRLNKN